uniref:J domain-containing protein n=1 Tax=Tetraselmis chuii TaxID=63592 RepID=A0A7S1T169_9CHLO|mmetsp:Transcript_40036/g.71852  ORF Transcript_40036/g.71852 Transcript_40036/m.71852 type:complete len:228 (+) Transcript_40036:146-829(+)
MNSSLGVSAHRSPGRPVLWQPRAIPSLAGRSASARCRLTAIRRDPFEVLGLPSGQVTKAEVRAAYIQKIKLSHPDVSTDEEDATNAATVLNLAYEEALTKLESRETSTTGRAGFQGGDEFDRTSGPPDNLFINPFACNVDPFLWRELQEAARQGKTPEEGLLARGVAGWRGGGVYTATGAIQYVTREQLDILYVQLQAMELSFDLEVTAYLIDDMLIRAFRANSRRS